MSLTVSYVEQMRKEFLFGVVTCTVAMARRAGPWAWIPGQSAPGRGLQLLTVVPVVGKHSSAFQIDLPIQFKGYLPDFSAVAR